MPPGGRHSRSKNRNRLCAGGSGTGGATAGRKLATSGIACTTSAAPAPRSATKASRSVVSAYVRTIWVHGQYAGAPSTSAARPTSTVAPRRLARFGKLGDQTGLPDPGLAGDDPDPPRPANAPTSPASMDAISPSRPTNSSPQSTARGGAGGGPPVGEPGDEATRRSGGASGLILETAA